MADLAKPAECRMWANEWVEHIRGKEWWSDFEEWVLNHMRGHSTCFRMVLRRPRIPYGWTRENLAKSIEIIDEAVSELESIKQKRKESCDDGAC